MPTLQVRDLPQSLYDKLQVRAAQEHRSMAQQTIVALEEHLRQKPRQVHFQENQFAWMDGTPEERAERAKRKRKLFERIDALNADWTGPKMTSDEIVEMIRDMREERADRIMEVLAQSDGGAGDLR